VRIVVPVPAGGGVDSIARIVAQHLNAVWGEPFIVDNRPGAGGSLGAEIVSRATPDGYPAVMTGQVNWMLGSPISAQPLMKAGRLKGIAVTSAARSRALPDLPAIAETVPGYEVTAWFALFAPAGVPPKIIDQLYKEAAKAVTEPEPELTRRMEAGGTETVGNPPREFAQQVKAEYAKWRDLVKKTGLKVQ